MDERLGTHLNAPSMYQHHNGSLTADKIPLHNLVQVPGKGVIKARCVCFEGTVRVQFLCRGRQLLRGVTLICLRNTARLDKERKNENGKNLLRVVADNQEMNTRSQTGKSVFGTNHCNVLCSWFWKPSCLGATTSDIPRQQHHHPPKADACFTLALVAIQRNGIL